MTSRIIIRTPNHLGDCIMALPMINETSEAYPNSHITLLVPENLSEIYQANPGIDEIIKIPAKHVHGLIAVTKIKDLISAGNYDIGYILPPSFGAAASFKLGGVKERIGYIADGRRLLLTKPLPLSTPLNIMHRADHYFNLLRRGAGIELEFVAPKLFLNDGDLQSAGELLNGFGVEENDRYAVIAFQAVAESRRWGLENYTELAVRLNTEFGLKIILIGSGDDRDAGDEIVTKSESDRIYNFAAKTSIRELGAILSRAQIFIGNDSGPAHMAAAVDIPLVVLSGADDPKSTSPISEKKHLIYMDQLECISCVKNKCPLKGEQFMACMKLISVNNVMEKIEEILKK